MKGLLTGFLLASTCGLAQAQVIEIKDIRMGMTQAEVAALYPQGLSQFTIGGYHAFTGKGPLLSFDANGKLGSFQFPYRQDLHSTFKALVKEKYPTMVCRDSVVQNNMGAQYAQESCFVHGDDAVLNIVHYAGGTLEQGRMMVLSKVYLRQEIERDKSQLNDRKKDF